MVAYYYTRDHLASVREMCSSTGTITSRMAYDPYGRTTTVSGTVLPTKQYAGMYEHQQSGLYLPILRGGYDSNTGKFIQRDWMAEKGGINLYEYVLNDPINFKDSLGLKIEIVKNPNNTHAGPYNFPVIITYHNDPGECCKNIKFIQSVVLTTNGRDNFKPFDTGPNPPSSKYYPTDVLGYGGPTPDGGMLMHDVPGYDNTNKDDHSREIWTFTFLTCAKCIDDPSHVRNLGCVSWGYTESFGTQTPLSGSGYTVPK